MTNPAQEIAEAREFVRRVAMSLPPSDFGSGRAINAMAAAIVERDSQALARWEAAMKEGETPSAAIQNLQDNQRQLDADGVMVGVSRQALDEVLAYLAPASAPEGGGAERVNADLLEALRELHACNEAEEGEPQDFTGAMDRARKAIALATDPSHDR